MVDAQLFFSIFLTATTYLSTGIFGSIPTLFGSASTISFSIIII